MSTGAKKPKIIKMVERIRKELMPHEVITNNESIRVGLKLRKNGQRRCEAFSRTILCFFKPLYRSTVKENN